MTSFFVDFRKGNVGLPTIKLGMQEEGRNCEKHVENRSFCNTIFVDKLYFYANFLCKIFFVIYWYSMLPKNFKII